VKPKKHHGYMVLLFLVGTLLPPIAVAMRFGIGSDFYLNCLLTLCGYIPGHVHYFYIYNIRNNKTHARTPKWAQKAGVVDTSKIERNKKRSQWANAYNDRLPQSALEGEEYAEDQVPDRDSVNDQRSTGKGKANGKGLWTSDEERFYGENGRNSVESGSGSTGGSGGRRWKFNDSDTGFGDASANAGSVEKKKKKKKKDRWERTEDVYATPDDGKKKKKKSKKNRSTAGDSDMYNNNHGAYDDPDRRSDFTGASTNENDFPEDPEGGAYGRRRETADSVPRSEAGAKNAARGAGGDELAHEF